MYMLVRHLRHQSTASRLLLVPCILLAALGPNMANVSCVLSAVWTWRVGQSRLPWLACCRSVVSCGPQSTLLRIRCLGSRMCVSRTCLHTSVLVGSDARILCASPLRRWLGGLLASCPPAFLRGGSVVRCLRPVRSLFHLFTFTYTTNTF